MAPVVAWPIIVRNATPISDAWSLSVFFTWIGLFVQWLVKRRPVGSNFKQESDGNSSGKCLGLLLNSRRA